MGTCTGTSVPMCPHCLALDLEWRDQMGESDEWVAICPSCGKEYKAKMNVETTFSTRT